MKLPAKRRRRRDYRVSRLADDLGISGRTIKRCLNRHPELAAMLRAKRCDREWRFDYPESESEYGAYLPEARAALDRVVSGRLSRREERNHELMEDYIREHFGPYTDADRAEFAEAVEKAQSAEARLKAQQQLEKFDDCRRWAEVDARRMLKHDQAASRKYSKQCYARFKRYLGYGDAQRERDVDRLTLALTRKRARMKADKDGRWLDTDFDRWEADAKEIPGTARLIASRFKCPVRDAIQHWREHLERESEQQRRRHEHESAWAKERGLLKDGETTWREFHRPSGTWAHFSLPRVKTPAEISAECERIQELWPEPEDLKRAEEIKRAWEKRTLYEAALELVREDKKVSGENLRLLLFRVEQHEMEYKNYRFRQEEEKTLAGLDHIWFGQPYRDRPAARRLFERTNPFYGERGISRREFRQRYTADDIKEAESAALTADASDINRGSKPDDSQALVETEILKNMARLGHRLEPERGQNPQQTIDPIWASRHHQQVQAEKPAIEKWLAGLSDEDRKKEAEALSDSFSDNKPKRKNALETKFAGMTEQARAKLEAWLDESSFDEADSFD